MDDMNSPAVEEKVSKSNWLFYVVISISIILIIYFYALSSPLKNKNVTIHIGANDSLTKISNQLKDKNVVRSSFALKFLVYIFSGDRHISSGDYLFAKEKNVFSIAWQLSRGVHNVDRIKITFKEGMTNNDMSILLADKIPSFRKDLFLSDQRSLEGYLFPDTYFFYPMSTTDEILIEITSNFKKRISALDSEIKSSGKNLKDIIIMASILEKEANGKEDSPVISGILWKRIKIGMPLQVDAARVTYEKEGLPEKPISNPGISMLESAINPKSSPYLFYLHDQYGNVHYAADFSEHRSNIARYLK